MRKARVMRVSGEPGEEGVVEAARVLNAGGLVAFPTETVYGLGAVGLDADAVRKIFEAKGRPATNPVILHVADIEGAKRVVAEWPEAAQRLAERFWPGPLTIVAKKAAEVPSVVCAGLDTVAVRVPDHPVAQALLREVGVPLAAPSANPYTRVSPTTAEHVVRGMGGAVDLVLDGGPTAVGIESTLVSVVEDPPVVLREGMIGVMALREVVPDVQSSPSPVVLGDDRAHPSPGLAAVHYSPGVPVRLVEEVPDLVGGGVICRGSEVGAQTRATVRVLPDDAEGYARGLYSALHELEAIGVTEIAVVAPPRAPGWEAIWDRLRRSAGSEEGDDGQG